jgi:glycosyltransferase involved in cell wall biosynthesis
MTPNPLRVVFIIQDYYPRLGGAQRQIAEQAPLLKNLGVEITVLTRRYPGLKPFEIIGGVPVHRLPIPGPKAIAAISFILSATWKIIRLRPDLIHAQELLSPGTTAVLARGLTGIPVVAKVLRGGQLGDMAKISRGSLGKWRVPFICNNIDGFAVISQEIDAELAGAGVPVSKRFPLTNGVDTARFAPLPAADKQALRQRLGFSAADKLAVYTGRLEPEKRIDQVIQLWPQICQQHPGARLLLLGAGKQEADLRQMAGDGIEFIGQVDDVLPYLQAADLFLLPSATEGLSNSMLEALSCGLPVIATTVGGAEDVLTHNENG